MAKRRADVVDFVEDFDELRLGYGVEKTVRKYARTAAAAPSRSFPEMDATDSELIGRYRILSSLRVTADKLLAPHSEAAVARGESVPQVLAIADTTDFNFRSPREGLGSLGAGGHGFFFHATLGVCAQTRAPLGLLAHEMWARPETPKSAKKPATMKADVLSEAKEKERTRWGRVALQVEERCASLGTKPVHVMDREGDTYEVIAALLGAQGRFVIRAKHDRRVFDEAGNPVKLFSAVSAVSANEQRDAFLNARKRKGIPAADKKHPPRAARMATLEFSATTVVVPRPKGVSADLPETLTLNVVEVREPNVPPGEVPISWVLLTTEPVRGKKQILRVVDWYRARWTVEEFFKALKTGCRMEARQLESRHALQNTLAMFVPIACQMLRARTLASHGHDIDARKEFDEKQLATLRLLSRRPLPSKPTLKEALHAIAGIGGHWRSNGDPGWQVLARGFQKLTEATELLALAASSAGTKTLRRFV